MKRILHHLNSNLLLKIASFNSVAVLIRVLAGFMTSKAIAVFIGAEGLALIGNLRNFAATTESFATLGFSNGVVKYVAEFKKDDAKLKQAIGTVLITVFMKSILGSLLFYLFAEPISLWIFNSAQSYVYVIKFLALALPFTALNLVLIAIINGLSKYNTVVKINIYSQLFGLAITLLLIWKSQLDGALVASVVIPGLLFFVTLFSFFDSIDFFKTVRLSSVNLKILKNLSSYSVMALFTATVMPLVFVLIRNYLIDHVGLKDAGFWEAIRRISNYYLMFVSSLLALYILPRFSEIKTSVAFRKEVVHFYKTVIPIFAVALIVIYFFRSFIIQVLFTEEFQPVAHLFKWQLLGDFLKVISSVIAFQLIAKKMVLYYLGIELFSIVTLYLASIYFIDLYGVEGAVIAHFVNFALHTIVIAIVFKKLLFGRQNYDI
ncbi:PST family polysaccharide transporter [Gelidibacter sediminis]|uniref:PST family polysaccharide transporter n=1 Tax=Gelidibacter sediminis TaxID=1608710 RepID=A0A4R7PYM2_9FLAO|nr:O-antigen translocase [Gelidibacter sediminis]TDU39512.1 PST family polysaccharide transporter [Gelidibacter sediminis]